MAGNYSKNKGYRYENELVHKFQDLGVIAHRVPLSGACEGYKDDLVVMDQYNIEAKRRKKLNQMFYNVLAKCKFGIAREDNNHDIVFMKIETFVDLIKQCEQLIEIK